MPLMVGKYEGHAFLMKNIEKLVRVYVCPHCQARFTASHSLSLHINRCCRGEPRMEFPNKPIELPRTAFEKAFFPDKQMQVGETSWIESETRRLGIHICHAAYGHGGQRRGGNELVDGFHTPSRTVFQFHGCKFHGCPKCYPDREAVVSQGNTVAQLF